jgi:hypothetical protein
MCPFAVDGAAPTDRPVTFFYNGGPGSSSVFLLLGSFGPRRIRTSMPQFTPPAPYMLEDNPDSLLDQNDLVLINPAGLDRAEQRLHRQEIHVNLCLAIHAAALLVEPVKRVSTVPIGSVHPREQEDM